MSFKIDEPSKSEFEKCPEHTGAATICDVRDLGMKEVTWKGETKLKPKFLITLLTTKSMDDGRPFVVSDVFTTSLHENARFRKSLKQMRGHDVRPEEWPFDPECLIGTGVMISVAHSEDGKYVNISSYMPLMEGVEAPDISEFVRHKDREENNEEPPF